MSGGHWDYRNDYLAQDIFGWSIYPDYGEAGFSQVRRAMRINPLEDKEVSALLWDIFCLLHSYDWYVSGDTGKEDYQQDLQYFKQKWFKSRSKRLKEIVEMSCEDLKTELLQMIGENVYCNKEKEQEGEIK